MKVAKSVLEQIVKEEVAAHVRSLLEAPKKPADVVDADDEKHGKEKEGGKGEEKPTKPSAGPKGPKQQSDAPKPKKGPDPVPAQEPEDGETSGGDDNKDAQAADDKETEEEPGEEDAEDVTGGKISKELTGKTIQSITMEPESKILPGAQEVTLTFREVPDPLKILITKTGQVKFHFRGLHNTLGEDTQPAIDSPVPQNVDSGNVTKKTTHADKFSMTNDEYLKWVKDPPDSLTVVSATSGKPIAKMDRNALRRSLAKAAFMKGMAKGISSDAEYWIAPIFRK